MGVFTTAAHTWLTNEIPTSANMNGQIRDLINGFGAWTAYSPSWTSSGTAPALGNGTLTGAYTQIGKMVWWQAALTAGSTTTFGTGTYFLSLPVACSFAGNTPIGHVDLIHAGSQYLGIATLQGSSTTAGFLTQAAAGASALVTATSPFTWASGDVLNLSGTYQAT